MAKPNIKIPEAFDFLFQPARVKVAVGGRGGAKSESIGRYLLIKGLEQPENIVCGREFQASIKDSVHSMLGYFISEYKLTRDYNVLNTEIRGNNGTSFSFVGLHHNINNIKSMHKIKRFWGEEAQTFSQTSLDILFPTIRDEDSELIFSMNPDLIEDAAYDTLITNPRPNSIVRWVNYWDNPYFPPVLERDRQHDQTTMPPEKYLNIWEGKPKTVVEGAVYADEMLQAAKDERIGEVAYDPARPVCTFWDLGWADYTSIWFAQIVGHEFRIIDFYQNQFKKTPHYCEILQEKGYRYDRIYLPHDADNESGNAERTWKQIIEMTFPNAYVEILENFSGAVKKGIEAARNVFPLCTFDKVRCADGLQALRHYHYKIDPDTKRISKEPEHDHSSHAADAFRYLAMAITEERKYPAYTGQAPQRGPMLG